MRNTEILKRQQEGSKRDTLDFQVRAEANRITLIVTLIIIVAFLFLTNGESYNKSLTRVLYHFWCLSFISKSFLDFVKFPKTQIQFLQKTLKEYIKTTGLWVSLTQGAILLGFIVFFTWISLKDISLLFISAS